MISKLIPASTGASDEVKVIAGLREHLGASSHLHSLHNFMENHGLRYSPDAAAIL